jgi:hypothetical protein
LRHSRLSLLCSYLGLFFFFFFTGLTGFSGGKRKIKKKNSNLLAVRKSLLMPPLYMKKILHTRKKRGDGWMDVKGGRNSLFILFNFDLKHFDVIMKIVFPNH